MAKSYFHDGAAWRELVRGEQGEDGPIGPRGLTGVKGDQGPPGTLELIGTTPSITVDTSVGTRVFVGDTMVYGDTGWVELDLPNERFVDGTIAIRRVNEVVTLKFTEVAIEGIDSDSYEGYLSESFIPSGFRPLNYNDRPVGIFGGVYARALGIIAIHQHTRLYYTKTLKNPIGVGVDRASGEIRYTADSTWPSVLP